MSSVPANAGVASGINNAASRIGGVVAVALFGIVMVPIFDRSLRAALEGADIAPAVVQALDAQRSKLAAIELPAGLAAASSAAVERAIAQAFVAGFRWIMVVSTAFAVAGAVGAWILIGDLGGNKDS